jgi:hypothetical protein
MAVISRESLINKVRKLLALSENNPELEEAKKAAAKAQELIARHNIQQAFLKLEQNDATDADVMDTYIHKSGRVATWLRTIAYALSEANGCAMYYTVGEGIHCVGEEDDIALVSILLNYLASEVQHLCKQECHMRHMDKSRGRVFANNFKMGASQSLSQRLKDTIKKVEEETLQHPQGKYALAVVSNKLVRANNHLPKLTSTTSRYRRREDAFSLGEKAGSQISLNPNTNRLRG